MTAQLVKCLPYKHKDQHPIPEAMETDRHGHMFVIPVLGGRDRSIPGAHWPANLGKLVSSRPIVSNKVDGVHDDDIWGMLHCPHSHVHTPPHIHVDI